jgi:hypothetical protein
MVMLKFRGLWNRFNRQEEKASARPKYESRGPNVPRARAWPRFSFLSLLARPPAANWFLEAEEADEE